MDLSLLGLARHLAGVERHWFLHVTAGDEVAGLYVEYAQHLGHADLLRERIDGRVGQ